MHCSKCDKSNPSGSNFCQKCGTKLTTSSSESKPSEKNSNNFTDTTLWDKFVELYDSKDKEREKYTNLMSNEAWELIDRVGVNSFEKFIEEKIDKFNDQPYKVIEQLKNTFKWCISGGYWMWYAEAFYNNSVIKQFKSISVEGIKDEWSKIAFQDLSKTMSSTSEKLQELMNIYHKLRVDELMENESMKELTIETVEKMKEALILNIIWGYAIAMAENTFRKK